MVTLTKLLVIRIVANIRSELLLNHTICESTLLFSSSSSFKSFGLREKKAISEPEAKAEANISRKAKKADRTTPKDGEIK
jgi:hypothetical protein